MPRAARSVRGRVPGHARAYVRTARAHTPRAYIMALDGRDDRHVVRIFGRRHDVIITDYVFTTCLVDRVARWSFRCTLAAGWLWRCTLAVLLHAGCVVVVVVLVTVP